MQSIYNPKSLYLKHNRTPEIQASYNQRLAKITAKGLDPEEFVIKTYLQSTDVCLYPNYFHYDNPGYKQYVLWLMNGWTEKEVIEYVLERKPKTVYIGYNLPKDQSVKFLRHYHVFETI
jgi:hypothetical protein